MSKSKKVINYAAMVCAIIAIIFFCIDKDWDAALWAMIAFMWMVDCHLTEDSYYKCKESLDKLIDEYARSLIKRKKN